jgi:gamma-glutamylcyclotransferase (GGCT)/AIG2-like uncharacterized protein YtfP
MSSYLFVYGTLRHAASHPMAAHLNQQAKLLGPASYQGKLYKVADYPAVIASSNPTDKVYGEVYQLFSADLWSILDDYEECSPSFAQPTEYRRLLQTIYLANGDEISAWVYLYNRSVSGFEVIESGDFLGKSLSSPLSTEY